MLRYRRGLWTREQAQAVLELWLQNFPGLAEFWMESIQRWQGRNLEHVRR